MISGPAAQQNAPPKPPRPLSPQQQAENTLKEAFPTIDASVVKAVLVASGWDVERAFHALLGWWLLARQDWVFSWINATRL